MKIKSGLWVLGLIIFLTIGFQCDQAGYAAIRDIERIDVFDPATNEVLQTPVSTHADSISLMLELKVEVFASNDHSLSLMNAAWADCDYGQCMANAIVDIRIYSDKPIYGLAAGENLSAQLLFSADGLVGKYPLHEFLDMLPQKDQDYFHLPFHQMFVNFNSKPAPDVYTFRIEVEDDNDHIFIATAPAVEWL